MQPDDEMTGAMERALRFLPAGRRHLAPNAEPNWIWDEDQDQALLRIEEDGTRHAFTIIDGAGAPRPAFDHGTMAQALARHGAAEPDALPLRPHSLSTRRDELVFAAFGTMWRMRLSDGEVAPAPFEAPSYQRAPDRRRAVVLHDHNLWLVDLQSGKDHALTRDGEPLRGYGGMPQGNTFAGAFHLSNSAPPPLAAWSPDGRYLATHRLDETLVRTLHVAGGSPQGGVLELEHVAYRCALAGDAARPRCTLLIIDIETGEMRDIETFDIANFSLFERNLVWWSADGALWYVVPSMGDKELAVKTVQARSGEACVVLTETGTTYVEATPAFGGRPNIHVGPDGDIIWWSERGGWGRLYALDRNSGGTPRPLTSGPWQVRQIIRTDDARGMLYFSGGGREPGLDPYFDQLYRISLGDGETVRLTAEPSHYTLRGASSWVDRVKAQLDGLGAPPGSSFSPSGRFYLTTRSRPDQAPETALHRADGTLLRAIAKADISPLLGTGWRPPEPFEVAVEGSDLPLRGLIYRPPEFEPADRYAVIESIYPGPQTIRTPRSFADAAFDGELAPVFAALGFIVVVMDGRGTPFRSKAFHDESYGRLGDRRLLADHVQVLKTLGRRDGSFDLSRVGIYGHSAGGFAACRAILQFPEFFKVAVASSGNHDLRGYIATWGETFQGPYAPELYAACDNAMLAGRLEGKLLLACGDMDVNTHPALTLRLAEAFTRAGKEVELLVLPGRGHGLNQDPTFIRAAARYFLKHLGAGSRAAAGPSANSPDAGETPVSG